MSNYMRGKFQNMDQRTEQEERGSQDTRKQSLCVARRVCTLDTFLMVGVGSGVVTVVSEHASTVGAQVKALLLVVHRENLFGDLRLYSGQSSQ